jgi:hypothetical protein
MRDRPVRRENQSRTVDVMPGEAKGIHVALRQCIKASASWESVAQKILDSSSQWIATQCREAERPALSVNLGFGHDEDLLRSHRLEDYAVVIADLTKELCGVQFQSLRLSKHQGESTTVAIGEATDVGRPPGLRSVTMETRRSYSTPAFGDEICDQTASLGSVLVPNVPLGLQVSYVTGLPRTWSRLWKPTLSGIFANRVDSSQVVDLLFDHRSVGDELGHSVRLTISAWRTSATGQRSKESTRRRTQ